MLGELLVFVGLLTVLSVWLLPKALEERMEENADHAREYLRLIHASEQLWLRERGGFVDLRTLAESVPNPPDMPWNLRTPGLHFEPPMVFDEEGIGHRGGYRFRVGLNQIGRVSGCWAWPNLREYSGENTFWVDFDTGEVWLTAVQASWFRTPSIDRPDENELVEKVVS